MEKNYFQFSIAESAQGSGSHADDYTYRPSRMTGTVKLITEENSTEDNISYEEVAHIADILFCHSNLEK